MSEEQSGSDADSSPEETSPSETPGSADGSLDADAPDSADGSDSAGASDSTDASDVSGTSDTRLVPPAVVAAIIAIPLVLVLGVILVGRQVLGASGPSQDDPLTVAAVPQDYAETPECAEFMAALPDDLGDGQRVEILDPAPPGTAAYRLESGDPVVVRCGMLPPPTFTGASPLQVVNHVQWFHEPDPDEMITDATWVTVDRVRYVALTMPRDADTAPIVDVSNIVADVLEEKEPEPGAVE